MEWIKCQYRKKPDFYGFFAKLRLPNPHTFVIIKGKLMRQRMEENYAEYQFQ